MWIVLLAERHWEGRPEEVKALYAKAARSAELYLSRTGHVESCLNLGGPPSKAKYEIATDRGKYREGKVKSTPGGE